MRKGIVFGLLGVAAASVAAVAISWSPQSGPSTGTVDALAIVRPPVSNSRSKATVAKAPRPEQPVAVAAPAAGTLPAAYRVLLTRSIFCPHPKSGGKGAVSVDSMLALRGISQQGAGFVAFVEDTASKVARQVRVGDTIGRGKVIDIDLHAVKFTAGRQTTRIAVGQTFDGGTSSVTPAGPALATAHTLPE